MSNVNLGPIVNQLNSLTNAVDSVNAQVSQVSAQVGVVSADLRTVTDELLALREEFNDFVRTAERTANIQRSETKLGTLKDDLEREYGHYAVVRRSSIGTLQAFDIGNVSDKTVQQVSEELMIQTPRYWLAPALVALAAWSRDNQALAERSVEAAFSRDRAKTSLFFALVLRRSGRLDGASRWLRHYFTSLDPAALGREFGVVLESVSHDGFGPEGKALALSRLDEWSAKLRDDPAIVEQQIDTWQRELSVNRGVVDADLFPRLAAHSPQWDDVRDVLEHASAFENVIAKYRGILDAPARAAESVEERMDDLLETLVTEYDEEELPLRREIVFHEAVIESSGDLDRAREAADATVKALDETLDAVTLVTQAAINPAELGISGSTRKLAIGAGKADFMTATGRYANAYRLRHHSSVDIELGPTHSNYASTLGFTTWTTSTATAQGEAESSLGAAWDAVVADYIERTRFKNTAFVVPAIVTVAVTIVAFLIHPIAGVVALLASGGISAWLVWRKKAAADAAVAQASQSRDNAFAVSRDIYRDALAEWVDAEIVYREQDAKETQLLELLSSWTGFVEGRAVA